MRRLLFVAIAFIAAAIFEYWLPAVVRHFVSFGVASRLVRPAFSVALIGWFLACPAARFWFPISWRWTWVLLIPLVYFAQNVIGLLPHPKFFPAMLALALVLDGIAIGFMEEFLFRGVAFLGDAQASPKTTVFLTALAFSLVHFTGLTTGVQSQVVRTLVFDAFPAGVALGIVRMATGSIAWPVVLHGLIDATAYFTYPHWTAFGRAGAIAVSLASLATGLLFLLHPAMRAKRLTMRWSQPLAGVRSSFP